MAISTRVLVVAPHQDDEAIGCGGTIAHLLAGGHTLTVQHIFRGCTGVAGASPAESAELRNREAWTAAATMGYTVAPNLGLEDRASVDTGVLTRHLVARIRETRAEIVFAPHFSDGDTEHEVVARAAHEACWLAAGSIWPELGVPVPQTPALLGYEVWQPLPRVAVFVDITGLVQTKIAMIGCFKSQPAEAWTTGSLGLNAYRGTVLMGHGHAEAFDLSPVGANGAVLLGILASPASRAALSPAGDRRPSV